VSGKFGRRPVRYYHSIDGITARSRVISPPDTQQDDTDYMSLGPLNPGVKVSGSSMSSPAGGLLQRATERSA